MKTTAKILTVLVLLYTVRGAWAQTPGTSVGGRNDFSVAPATPGIQNLLLMGRPSGSPTPYTMSLTLKDAVDRGLRYNLGIILSQQNIRAAQSSRIRALSELLPHISVQTSEVVQQVNLAAFGIPPIPGVGSIVGPFSVFDVRAILSQSLNLSKLSELRSQTENLKATGYSYQNTRDLVALVCLQLYMQAAAGNSRVDASQAQLKTAQALFDLAQSRRSAGFIAGIEVLRSQVQMQAQQQRLILARNDYAKQKLALAQAIGLPLGQEFELADSIPYAPSAPMSMEDALNEAYRNRQDYQGLQAQVQAAEESRKAAARLRVPWLDINANYGDIGNRPFASHGTFFLGFTLRVPIFQGRETEAKILASDAVLEQKKADLESLRAHIHYELSTVFLDLKSSDERLRVAKSNLDLAGEQVAQAQDRFAAGVVSNIEVVLAQDALAVATEDYISSLYAHNIAKANLAEALGMAAVGYERLLTGK